MVALGPNITHTTDLKLGSLVGIRFASRICRRCEFCLAGTEQYCVASTNHLHHEDGSFQQYIALDADYLTLLPDDVDPKVMGPVLCAGLTAYKVRNKNGSVFGLRMCVEYPIGGFEREYSAWELACCCWGWWWAWASGW